jgi:hypothetical protein
MTKKATPAFTWTKTPAQVAQEQKARTAAWQAVQNTNQAQNDAIRKAEQQAAEQAQLRIKNANVTL